MQAPDRGPAGRALYVKYARHWARCKQFAVSRGTKVEEGRCLNVIERTEHDDVTALRMDWWRSRVAGYQVYAFVVRGVLIDSGFPGAADDVGAFLAERRDDSRVRARQANTHRFHLARRLFVAQPHSRGVAACAVWAACASMTTCAASAGSSVSSNRSRSPGEIFPSPAKRDVIHLTSPAQ